MLKLLIADSSEEFRMALADQVAGSYVIRCCQQGKEALELIGSYKPDILVLDLMLPELDGISVLQQAAELGAQPMVLATTRILNDYVQDAVNRLGVGYLMVKPCDIKATAVRLGDLTMHLKPLPPARPDIHTAVANILRRLGIATKLRGYGYLREAIPVALRQRGQLVTKEIYPAVARACDVNKEQVERCIRTAIGKAFKRRNEEIWRLYFQPEPDGTLVQPSNGAFIFALAEWLAAEGYSGVSGGA